MPNNNDDFEFIDKLLGGDKLKKELNDMVSGMLNEAIKAAQEINKSGDVVANSITSTSNKIQKAIQEMSNPGKGDKLIQRTLARNPIQDYYENMGAKIKVSSQKYFNALEKIQREMNETYAQLAEAQNFDLREAKLKIPDFDESAIEKYVNAFNKLNPNANQKDLKAFQDQMYQYKKYVEIYNDANKQLKDIDFKNLDKLTVSEAASTLTNLRAVSESAGEIQRIQHQYEDIFNGKRGFKQLFPDDASLQKLQRNMQKSMMNLLSNIESRYEKAADSIIEDVKRVEDAVTHANKQEAKIGISTRGNVINKNPPRQAKTRTASAEYLDVNRYIKTPKGESTENLYRGLNQYLNALQYDSNANPQKLTSPNKIADLLGRVANIIRVEEEAVDTWLDNTQQINEVARDFIRKMLEVPEYKQLFDSVLNYKDPNAITESSTPSSPTYSEDETSEERVQEVERAEERERESAEETARAVEQAEERKQRARQETVRQQEKQQTEEEQLSGKFAAQASRLDGFTQYGDTQLFSDLVEKINKGEMQVEEALEAMKASIAKKMQEVQEEMRLNQERGAQIKEFTDFFAGDGEELERYADLLSRISKNELTAQEAISQVEAQRQRASASTNDTVDANEKEVLSYENVKKKVEELIEAYNSLTRNSLEHKILDYDLTNADKYLDGGFGDSQSIDNIESKIKELDNLMKNVRDSINSHGGVLGDKKYNWEDLNNIVDGLKAALVQYHDLGGNIDDLKTEMSETSKRMIDNLREEIIAVDGSNREYSEEVDILREVNKERAERYTGIRNEIVSLGKQSKNSNAVDELGFIPDISSMENFNLDDIDPNNTLKQICDVLGIEIPKAANKAKKAIEEATSEAREGVEELSQQQKQEEPKQTERKKSKTKKTDTKTETKEDKSQVDSSSITSEQQALENLERAINAVTVAIAEKNNAIKSEEVQMDSSVNAEIVKLKELENKLNEIKDKFKEGIASGLLKDDDGNNITIPREVTLSPRLSNTFKSDADKLLDNVKIEKEVELKVGELSGNNQNTDDIKDQIESETGNVNPYKELLSKDFSTKNATEAWKQLKSAYDEFKNFHDDEEKLATEEGRKAAYNYYMSYKEALSKHVADSRMIALTPSDNDTFDSERNYSEFKKVADYDDGTPLLGIETYFDNIENKIKEVSNVYDDVISKLGNTKISQEVIDSINEYVNALFRLNQLQSDFEDNDPLVTQDDINRQKKLIEIIKDGLNSNINYTKRLEELVEQSTDKSEYAIAEENDKINKNQQLTQQQPQRDADNIGNKQVELTPTLDEAQFKTDSNKLLESVVIEKDVTLNPKLSDTFKTDADKLLDGVNLEKEVVLKAGSVVESNEDAENKTKLSKDVTLNPKLSDTFKTDSEELFKDIILKKETTLNPKLSETFQDDANGLLDKIKIEKEVTLKAGQVDLSEANVSSANNQNTDTSSIQDLLSKSFDTDGKKAATTQLRETYNAFEKFYNDQESLATQEGAEAAYKYYMSYKEALNKGVADKTLSTYSFSDSKYDIAEIDRFINDTKNRLNSLGNTDSPTIKVDPNVNLTEWNNKIDSAISEINKEPKKIKVSLAPTLDKEQFEIDANSLLDGINLEKEVTLKSGNLTSDALEQEAEQAENAKKQIEEKNKVSEESLNIAQQIMKLVGAYGKRTRLDIGAELDNFSGSNTYNNILKILSENKGVQERTGAIDPLYQQVKDFIKSSSIKFDSSIVSEFGDNWRSVVNTISTKSVTKNGTVDIITFLTEMNDALGTTFDITGSVQEGFQQLYDYLSNNNASERALDALKNNNALGSIKQTVESTLSSAKDYSEPKESLKDILFEESSASEQSAVTVEKTEQRKRDAIEETIKARRNAASFISAEDAEELFREKADNIRETVPIDAANYSWTINEDGSLSGQIQYINKATKQTVTEVYRWHQANEDVEDDYDRLELVSRKYSDKEIDRIEAQRKAQQKLLNEQTKYQTKLSGIDAEFKDTEEYRLAENAVKEMSTASDPDAAINKVQVAFNNLNNIINTVKRDSRTTLDPITSSLKKFNSIDNIIEGIKLDFQNMGYSAEEASEKVQRLVDIANKLKDIDRSSGQGKIDFGATIKEFNTEESKVRASIPVERKQIQVNNRNTDTQNFQSNELIPAMADFDRVWTILSKTGQLTETLEQKFTDLFNSAKRVSNSKELSRWLTDVNRLFENLGIKPIIDQYDQLILKLGELTQARKDLSKLESDAAKNPTQDYGEQISRQEERVKNLNEEINRLRKDSDNNDFVKGYQSLLGTERVEAYTNALDQAEIAEKRLAAEQEKRTNATNKTNLVKQYDEELLKVKQLKDAYAELLRLHDQMRKNPVMDYTQQIEAQQKIVNDLLQDSGLSNSLNNQGRFDNQTDTLGVKKVQAFKDAVYDATKAQTTFNAKFNDERINEVNSAIDRTTLLMNGLSKVNTTANGIDEYFRNAKEEIDKLNISLQHGMNFDKYEKEVNKIANSLINFAGTPSVTNANATKMYEDMKAYIESISNGEVQIKSFDAVKRRMVATYEPERGEVQHVTLQYNSLANAYERVKDEAKDALTPLQQLGNFFKGKFANLVGYIASFATFHEVWSQIKQGVTYVRELDTALTEMRKVSDETVESLKEFQQASFDIANSVGTTAKVIQNSTADWMRLGESLEEATESAKVSNILLNVSEFEDIDSATDALISMSQAYQDFEKIDIVDKMNNIGNQYSISTDGIATALQDSASSLTTAGNSLDEAIALITAGNAIVQDPASVGAGKFMPEHIVIYGYFYKY